MEENQNNSKISAKVDWSEGKESDFKDLHDAIKNGTAKKDEISNKESGDESDDEEKDMDHRAFANFNQVREQIFFIII